MRCHGSLHVLLAPCLSFGPTLRLENIAIHPLSGGTWHPASGHEMTGPASSRRCRQPVPFLSKADADAIRMPTLFIGGANTKGMPLVLHAPAAHVPDSRIAVIARDTHPMFEQAPRQYCEIVQEFLPSRPRPISLPTSQRRACRSIWRRGRCCLCSRWSAPVPSAPD